MEAKIIEKLVQVGMSKCEVKILFYLFKNSSGFAREIERDADLRQPEVSGATKLLIGRGWIKVTPVRSEGKGRPQNKYSLVKSKKDIAKAINKHFADKICSLEEDRKLFNELMKGA